MGLSIRKEWNNPHENIWIAVTIFFAVLAILLMVLLAIGVMKPQGWLKYFVGFVVTLSLIMTFVGLYVIYEYYPY
jgi:ABC-type multidrug transport system permease subunit